MSRPLDKYISEYDIHLNISNTMFIDEHDEQSSALDRMKRNTCTALCSQCKINPVYNKVRSICILCYENDDSVNQKCYNCDLCTKTRTYLNTTNEFFKLIGYGKFHIENTELWKCLKCQYCIELQVLEPSIARDMLHEQTRYIHTKHWCQKLIDKSICYIK